MQREILGSLQATMVGQWLGHCSGKHQDRQSWRVNLQTWLTIHMIHT
jgi:hypothetical protein